MNYYNSGAVFNINHPCASAQKKDEHSALEQKKTVSPKIFLAQKLIKLLDPRAHNQHLLFSYILSLQEMLGGVTGFKWKTEKCRILLTTKMTAKKYLEHKKQTIKPAEQ